MKISYSKKFLKEFKKCPPKIKQALKKRLQLFVTTPDAVILNNHQLSGQLKNYHSINVTGDWRALFILEKDDEVIFMNIGTHSQLYQ